MLSYIALALLTLGALAWSSARQDYQITEEKLRRQLGRNNRNDTLDSSGADSAHSRRSRKLQIYHEAPPQDSKANRYTTFKCIGGSQAMNTESMRQATFKDFPLNDPQYRTCLFRHVCAVNGKITVYVSPDDRSPSDYTVSGFNGEMFHTSHLRRFTLPLESHMGAIPEELPLHDSKVAFLDANSWSFNYGHYLIDNVIPTFISSRIFNLPYAGQQQLFETKCEQFSVLPVDFAHRTVTYDANLGTYQQACLANIEGKHEHFFDYAPMFLDEMKNSTVCFKKLMLGQGSTFGLKSLDLSRGVMLREFRDYVLDRMVKRSNESMPAQEDIILVGLRTSGAAGGELIADICDRTKNALAASEKYKDKYKVECFTPSTVSFEEEVRTVQRAKFVVSVHGTISYMALFSRDGTQQISLAQATELKENQMLLSATHFNTLYLTWDRLEQLPEVLHHSIDLSEAYFEDQSN